MMNGKIHGWEARGREGEWDGERERERAKGREG